MDYSNIPIELKKLDRWVLYRLYLDEKTGKYTKKPFNARTGGMAQSNNPRTWCDYDTARRVVGKYDGLGFMLGDGIFGVDIDGVDLKDSIVNEVITTLGSYAEVSPSGKGIHVICKGTKPQGACRKGNFECYEKGRFFTVTGKVIEPYTTLRDCTESIKPLFDKYLKKEQRAKKKATASYNFNRSDADIIETIRRSKQWDLFNELYSGNWSGKYPSQSEADLALCNMLAFYAQGDFDTVDRLFRSSGLMREKWDKLRGLYTYGCKVITQAIDGANCFYDPSYNKQIRTNKPHKGHAEQGESNAIAQPTVTHIPFILDGKKPMKVAENMKILLKHKGIKVRLNDLTRRLEFEGIEHDESLADVTFTKIKDFCTENDYKLSKESLYDFVYVIGAENRYNPVGDFLNECKSVTEDTGTDEIEKLLATVQYETKDKEVIDFYNKILLKWILNCIHIAFNTMEANRSLEFVIVFKGKQGLGKTRWATSFIPIQFYRDGLTLNLEKNDSIMQATKYWVVELGEIGSTFKKSDVDKLKSFISNKNDEFRHPYGRSFCIYPRRTAYMGTVNDDEFLRDKTGNRRFVVLPVESLQYINDVNPTRLWGQLMHLYAKKVQANEPLYMTAEEQAFNNTLNVAFTTKSEVEVALDDIFDWESEKLGACTVSMIAKYLRDEFGIHCKANAIRNTLNEKGYKSEEPFVAGKGKAKTRQRFWKLPYVEGLTLPF